MVYANVRDSIIGFADGLTVPFAVTAGLASTGNSRLVILGGLAELVSGSISMGLGAYLAALTDIDRYEAQHRKLLQTEKDLESKNHGIGARKELEEFFCEYGVEKEAVPAIEALLRNSDSRIKVRDGGNSSYA